MYIENNMTTSKHLIFANKKRDTTTEISCLLSMLDLTKTMKGSKRPISDKEEGKL